MPEPRTSGFNKGVVPSESLHLRLDFTKAPLIAADLFPGRLDWLYKYHQSQGPGSTRRPLFMAYGLCWGDWTRALEKTVLWLNGYFRVPVPSRLSYLLRLDQLPGRSPMGILSRPPRSTRGYLCGEPVGPGGRSLWVVMCVHRWKAWGRADARVAPDCRVNFKVWVWPVCPGFALGEDKFSNMGNKNLIGNLWVLFYHLTGISHPLSNQPSSF